MANQLQNIQVSYQQTSRGSGSDNQNYMRTRRLSVPAAEIRNRPRLLQLFNEATARQLQEKDDKSDDDIDDDDADDDDEQMNMAKHRHIQRHRTLTSIDDHKESASDDNDHEQMDSLKQESKSDGIDRFEATATNSRDDSDHDDGGSDNNCTTNDNDLINHRQQPATMPEKVSNRNNISESHKLKIQMFYQKLVEKLTPFEDRTWRDKFVEKIQELYCLLCMLVFTIR